GLRNIQPVPDSTGEFGTTEQFKEAAPVIGVDARGKDPGTGDAQRLHLRLLTGGGGPQYPGWPRNNGDFPVRPGGVLRVTRASWTIRTRGSSRRPVPAAAARRNDTQGGNGRMPKPLDAERPLGPRLHQAMRSVTRRAQPSGYHEPGRRPDHGETPRR